MQLDDPFPLDLVPLRARKAILQVFEGRCPSKGEIAKVSDCLWLKSPGIGPAALKWIHSVISAPAASNETPLAAHLADIELLQRLRVLHGELQFILGALEQRVSSSQVLRPAQEIAID
ncbi:hypothetical protein ILT44_21430 [Microvirga sp. BT689]|uniref:hypothetical protein n=1 Tax=Microvirga arvi TaxID=2778731 RepID=UPI0019522B5F|nr:hypothetical protein [Microvirga arvi]MBM6582772.1 hypothetical protein [Microvirga arvi]